MESHARSYHHGLEVNGHRDRYWVGFANTRALLLRNGYRHVLTKPQQYDSMIHETKEYTWLGVNDIQALSHQGLETRKERLMLIKVWRSESLRART
jgi:hypothetical protein